MQKLITVLSIGLLLGGLGLSACGEEASTQEDRTQAIADSIARADSMAMIQDSIERLENMQKMIEEETRSLSDSF